MVRKRKTASKEEAQVRKSVDVCVAQSRRGFAAALHAVERELGHTTCAHVNKSRPFLQVWVSRLAGDLLLLL